jgi:hypothetical protein
MSGRKACLKSGTRLVVDTHVLARAAEGLGASGASSPAAELLCEVLRICPEIVLTKKQEKESYPHLLRRAGYRLPFQQLPLIRRLDEANKLLRLPTSKLQSLDPKLAKMLFPGGLADDIHLYEAAMATDRIVITDDSDQLSARAEIERRTGVAVYAVDEVLAPKRSES